MNIPLITPALGYLMKGCYWLVQNYGIALILFTLVTKLITVPIQIKQQKSTANMGKLSPKLKKLQQKYGNNKQKYQEEMMKLYQEEGVNPMGSCLPMVVTFVILFAVLYVVYVPLTYMSNISSENIPKTENMITDMYTVSQKLGEKDYSVIVNIDKNGDLSSQIAYLEAKNDKERATILKENDLKETDIVLTEENLDLAKDYEKVMTVDKIKKTLEDDNKYRNKDAEIDDEVIRAIQDNFYTNPKINQFFADKNKITDKLLSRPQLLAFTVVDNGYGFVFDSIDSTVKDDIDNLDYTFLGVFLGDYPDWNNILLLIPIISLLSQLALTFVSQYYQKKNNPGGQQMGKGMNMFMYIMPLFSAYIAFSFPAGLGFYWILSSIFSLGQTIVLNKVYTPERMEKLEKSGKTKKKKSFYQKALEAQQTQNGTNSNGSSATVVDSDDYYDEDRKLSKAELKNYERQKLNEARRRMAEKYGEVYEEEETTDNKKK